MKNKEVATCQVATDGSGRRSSLSATCAQPQQAPGINHLPAGEGSSVDGYSILAESVEKH